MIEVTYAGGRIVSYPHLAAAADAIDAAARPGGVALAVDRRGARPVYMARCDGRWTRRERRTRADVAAPPAPPARRYRADIDG